MVNFERDDPIRDLILRMVDRLRVVFTLDSFGEAEYDQLWQDTVGDFLADIPFEIDRRGMKIHKYKGPFYDLAMINYRREIESRSYYFYLMMYNLEKVGCSVVLDEDCNRTIDDIVQRRAVPKSYSNSDLVSAVKKMAEVIKEEEIIDIKIANLSLAERVDGGRDVNNAKIHVAIQQCLGGDEPLTEDQIAKYKDESSRRRLYNLRELYGCRASEYTNMMKQFHVEKIRNTNNHAQPETVMRQNNSLQCKMAYEMVMLKLWPEIRDRPFSLELLESRNLDIDDIERFRENSSDDVVKLSRIFGIRKNRMIDDVKNHRKHTRKKIIMLINTVLRTTFDIEIKSFGKFRDECGNYGIIHDHPKKILINDVDFDLVAL
jgi:hypothetical protein